MHKTNVRITLKYGKDPVKIEIEPYRLISHIKDRAYQIFYTLMTIDSKIKILK